VRQILRHRSREQLHLQMMGCFAGIKPNNYKPCLKMLRGGATYAIDSFLINIYVDFAADVIGRKHVNAFCVT
jgi:hypothetical protein